MQEYKDSWAEIRPVLERKMKESGKTAKEISEISGVSYWAASRALREGIKNYNDRAEILCRYFNVKLEINANSQSTLLEQLQLVVSSVWDGTDAHAQLLMNLIKTTRSYKIEQR